MMCREKEYEPVHSDMMCDGCAFNKRTLSSKPCEHFSENICKSLVWREVGNRFMEILKEQRAALDRKKKERVKSEKDRASCMDLAERIFDRIRRDAMAGDIRFHVVRRKNSMELHDKRRMLLRFDINASGYIIGTGSCDDIVSNGFDTAPMIDMAYEMLKKVDFV